MADSRIDKWRAWMEGRIANEVHTIYLHREAFQRVGNIVRANGQLPDSYFWEYLRDTYAVTQAVAIRRQADQGPRVCSLGRLLREISEDSERVSRAFFVGMWDTEGEQEFDERFAGSVGSHLDPAIPRADLDALTATAAAVTTYVDEHLAHSDARAGERLLRFDDLDGAVDQLGDLLTKYTLLLTAKGLVTLVPVIQHDWLAVFEQPWIRRR